MFESAVRLCTRIGTFTTPSLVMGLIIQTKAPFLGSRWKFRAEYFMGRNKSLARFIKCYDSALTWKLDKYSWISTLDRNPVWRWKGSVDRVGKRASPECQARRKNVSAGPRLRPRRVTRNPAAFINNDYSDRVRSYFRYVAPTALYIDYISEVWSLVGAALWANFGGLRVERLGHFWPMRW